MRCSGSIDTTHFKDLIVVFVFGQKASDIQSDP